MFFYIYMMQNHIFSNVDGTYDAQNGPKWPSKHPKIAQNSPKPKKTQKTQKISHQLAISFKMSPHIGAGLLLFGDFGAQNPHF